MSAATARVNKKAAAAKEEAEVSVEEKSERSKLDPSAVTFEASEVVDKDSVVPSRAVRFEQDHPLYLDYVKSYQGDEAHRLVGDPEVLVKALRKIAGQLNTGVRILSKDETSVTYLAQPKRARRTAEEIAAGTNAADEEADSE